MAEFIVKITYEYNGTKFSYSKTVEADTADEARSDAESQGIVVEKPELLEIWVYPVTGR